MFPAEPSISTEGGKDPAANLRIAAATVKIIGLAMLVFPTWAGCKVTRKSSVRQWASTGDWKVLLMVESAATRRLVQSRIRRLWWAPTL